MKKSVAIYLRQIGTEPELLAGLRQIVEDRGDVVFGVFIDGARIEGKGKNAAWRRLLDSLDQIDQIILNDPGDVPAVRDFLAVLTTLSAYDTSILVPKMGIDTANGCAAVLDLVAAYRRAKKSAAIRRGQERAKKAGKHVGRPPIPMNVRRRILAELGAGSGVRSTAKRYGVSAGYVAAAKKAMSADTGMMAA
jgi:DNA invertase Pin-like site-specific DNA recombinase